MAPPQLSCQLKPSSEAIKKQDGSYEAYVDYGRQNTDVDALEWAVRAAEMGAGELVVTSIDNEGTGKGFDLELTRKISTSVPIPVIASGGAGNAGDIYDVIVHGKADAVSVASILHYNYIKHREYGELDFSREGNVEFLQGKRGPRLFSKIQDVTIPEIKANLVEHGIECRWQ